MSLVPSRDDYFCNGDSMFHVNKGVIAFKMDAAKHVKLTNTSAQEVENLGDAGSDVCGTYDKSHPQATLDGYGGAAARGYTFAGSSWVRVFHSQVIDLNAKAGSAIAFDILTDSRNVKIFHSYVQQVDAGWNFVPFEDGPTVSPSATAFHIGPDATKVKIRSVYGDDLYAHSDTDIVDDESGLAIFRKLCK